MIPPGDQREIKRREANSEATVIVLLSLKAKVVSVKMERRGVNMRHSS